MDDTATAKRALIDQAARAAAALHLINSSDKKLQCIAFGHALSRALTGDALAMFTVAHCLEKGKGVEPDEATARFWLVRSAMSEQPPVIALYLLATRHLDGALDHSDAEYGLKLLGHAAKAGNVAARKRLMLECDCGATTLVARKVTFDVLSVLAGAVSPNRYHVEAFLTFTKTYPASSIWDA